ncbi:hypothetical protein [Planomonospora sp. ID67723]|uniref:hypothetical protein n=1 Tax=Planomonospora sp. ID67723 TaxID=2738134 RepID=UPI001E362DFB|nr:hypothetical protein [Planomonospora sp. ID67723]
MTPQLLEEAACLCGGVPRRRRTEPAVHGLRESAAAGGSLRFLANFTVSSPTATAAGNISAAADGWKPPPDRRAAVTGPSGA